MRRIGWFVFLALFFVATIAQAQNTAAPERKFTFRSALDFTYLFLGPPAKVFEPNPRNFESLGSHDTREQVWQANLGLALRYPGFTINGLVPIRGVTAKPETVGLEIEALTEPLRLLKKGDRLKLGVVHYSDHDLFDDRYVIDVDAVVAKFGLYRSPMLEVWPEFRWYFVRDELSHVVTTDTLIRSKSILEHDAILWDSGVRVALGWSRTLVRLRAGDKGPSAIECKSEIMAPLMRLFPRSELAERTAVGVFGQYQGNMTNERHFGSYDFAFGIRLRFSLTDPRTATGAGSDLF